jgi:Tfp pilus assembly protein PilO
MNKFMQRLSPMERRFMVVLAVVLFIVLNFIFVWPHFGDRSKYQTNLRIAREEIDKFEKEIAQIPAYERQIAALERVGASVPQEDQSVDFLQTIRSEATRSGVNISGYNRLPTRTNQFFIELSQAVNIQSSEKALVTFLYNLGEGSSMTRVRGLSLRTDPPRQQLVANVTLVGSYQKKAPVRRGAAAGTNSVASTPATSNPR